VNNWLNILAGGASAIAVWVIGRIVIDNWKRTKRIEKEIDEKNEKKKNKKKSKL
jgi:hypothetical protein